MKIAIIAGFVIAVSSGAAFAHGTKSHEKKKLFVPANLEQVETSFGQTGSPLHISKTINVTMSDQMRFHPGNITVKVGQTIKFIVKNDGETLHEMVIGSTEDLKKHAALMARFPNMEHSEPYMAHADEGQTAEIIWTFTKPGTFEYGCLVPGHYEAGMHGTVTVIREIVAVKSTPGIVEMN